MDGAVGVRDLCPRRLPRRRLERRPRRSGGVGVQREDGGEVGARGAREAQAVLLWPRMGALVRAYAAGPVSLDAHAAEEPTPREPFASWTVVVLGVHPQRRLAITDERALQLPGVKQLARALVGIGVSLGEVDRHDVEGGARDQLRPLLGVD